MARGSLAGTSQHPSLKSSDLVNKGIKLTGQQISSHSNCYFILQNTSQEANLLEILSRFFSPHQVSLVFHSSYWLQAATSQCDQSANLAGRINQEEKKIKAFPLPSLSQLLALLPLEVNILSACF